jgi:AraC family transcriptional regulator
MPRAPPTPTAVQGGLAPWQVKLALRWLLHDLCADFPVGDIATLCGLSRSYFTRAFGVSLGLPPHRWLMRHRIQCAQEMLERTTESISAIAVSCGFSDQSHLTRMFHATVGSSPAAWRRQRKATGRDPAPRAESSGRGEVRPKT